MNRSPIPSVLWISFASIVALILLRVWLAMRGGTAFLLDATVWVLILIGLVAGHRWARALALGLPLFVGLLLLMRVGRVALVYWAAHLPVILPLFFCGSFYTSDRDEALLP